MLKNDEAFWKPTTRDTAVLRSWGGSQGHFNRLWTHTKDRWERTLGELEHAKLPHPTGRIIEFGAGMGLLDDLLGDDVTEILMLDNTNGFVNARHRPLSSRCRHVLFHAESIQKLQREERGSFDWLVAIAVFYHLDEATAIALIRELGQLLTSGGYVLIRGWNESTVDALRSVGTADRLFTSYPRYLVDTVRMTAVLAPDFQEVERGENLLVYRKDSRA